LRAPQEQDPEKTAIEMNCINKESIGVESDEKKEKMKIVIEDELGKTFVASSLYLYPCLLVLSSTLS